MDFRIYRIWGSTLPPESAPVYLDRYGNGVNVTENIVQAAVFAHGTVKCDGCSDWHFDAQEENNADALHGCTRKDLTNIGEVLAAAWDSAKSLLVDVWTGG